MKSILKLEGVKSLSRDEQSKISGERRYACQQRGRNCCELSPGGPFCEAGICIGIGGSGGCIWY